MFSLAVESMQGGRPSPNEEQRRPSYGVQGNGAVQDGAEGFDFGSRRRSTQLQQQIMQQQKPFRSMHSNTVSFLPLWSGRLFLAEIKPKKHCIVLYTGADIWLLYQIVDSSQNFLNGH